MATFGALQVVKNNQRRWCKIVRLLKTPSSSVCPQEQRQEVKMWFKLPTEPPQQPVLDSLSCLCVSGKAALVCVHTLTLTRRS